MAITGNPNACPLRAHSRYRPMNGQGCWCLGTAPIMQLHALGYMEEAWALRRSHSADDARSIGERLLRIVSELRIQHRKKGDKPEGARWCPVWNTETNRYEPAQTTSFEHALETIEHAGKWFRAVSGIGSGVQACAQS